MYPIPPSEHLVEMRTCKQCQASYPITDKDMEFYGIVSPTFGRKKYQIPPPTLCPDCRQQRRLTFRNERKLYKRKCDATRKDIVSIYSPDKPYRVYHQYYWWSDAWDPMDYGRKFDFSRSAMEQMGELMREVPRMSLITGYTSLENSEYTNYFVDSKNCYFSFNGGNNENCLYSCWFGGMKDSMDIDMVMNGNHCYDSVDLNECTFCFFSDSCSNTHRCSFVYSCIGCNDCLLCSNLTNKQYCIRNTQYSESEYKILRNKIIHGTSTQKLKDEFWEIRGKTIRKDRSCIKSENVIGNNLHYSSNNLGFDGRNIEGSKYIYSIWDTKDSMDCYELAYGCTSCYETSSADTISYGLVLTNAIKNINVIYSESVFYSSHLFLCTGLRNKSYCILNHQYTKEEYEILVPKIIEKMVNDGEWGEFFPASLSPFGYNETVAQEYYPLMREEVVGSSFVKELSRSDGGFDSETKSPTSFHSAPSLQRGSCFNWSDYEAPFSKVEKIIPASKLPDTIDSIPDDILSWAIECEVSGKPFRIIKQELEFYRKHHLPIPRRHPDVRHMDRMKMRNPRKLYERKCDKCAKDMITTYSPGRPERVYCEECYEREIN